MFQIDYLYIPLTGPAYISSDVCNSFDAFVIGNSMKMIFHHKVKSPDGRIVKFSSEVTTIAQKITIKEI